MKLAVEIPDNVMRWARDASPVDTLGEYELLMFGKLLNSLRAASTVSDDDWHTLHLTKSWDNLTKQ